MDSLMIEYAPLIILILIILFKSKLFVTPTQLANTKEEILSEIKAEYATKELASIIRSDISDIKQQLIHLNDYLIGNNR